MQFWRVCPLRGCDSTVAFLTTVYGVDFLEKAFGALSTGCHVRQPYDLYRLFVLNVSQINSKSIETNRDVVYSFEGAIDRLKKRSPAKLAWSTRDAR